MNRFRPRETSVLERIQNNRRLGFRDYIAYNWQIRSDWWPAGYKLNHRVIANQFRVLHYRSAHSPRPIQQRWRSAAKAFEARYFGKPGSPASVRFLNEHTAHRWL